MTHLLFDEYPLLIDRKLVLCLGLTDAIILQQIHYWIKNNEKNKINFFDGIFWTYNSYENWKAEFEFFGINTIKRAIKRLEKKGVLIIANYNKMKIDRTRWYSINYKELDKLIEIGNPLAQNGTMDKPKMGRPIPETIS